MPHIPKAQHYGSTSLVASLRAALESAELGNGGITWEVLAPLDQFHVGAAAATRDLADRLGIDPADHVLDVGSGLGGPSRQLATRYGCEVTGVDLNAPFIELATYLAECAGSAGKVRFLVADATDLPFADGVFDLAISQHVAMNIEDRGALYREIRRSLVPGGRLGLYDVVLGNGSPIHFPVPWARDASASFVITAEQTRVALEEAGFEVVKWRDATIDAMAWQQAQVLAARSRPERLKPLGLPLIMGSQFPEMVANLGRNFQEGRLGILQAIVRRRA